jgi:uncharacterized protein
MKMILIQFIKIYQKTLSPDHGWFKARWPHGYCRFQPSCSQYAIDALQQHGTMRGSMKAAWRILRCNPFAQVSYDPVTKQQ